MFQKKKIPQDDSQFGDYLAGLIDGNGHFSNIGQCIIAFHSQDVSHAYFIKTKIGYGSIRPVYDKQAVVLIITGQKGLRRVADLIHNKLRHQTRISQFNSFIADRHQIIQGYTVINNEINWESYWFSGFFDADGYFALRLVFRPTSANRLKIAKAEKHIVNSDTGKAMVEKDSKQTLMSRARGKVRLQIKLDQKTKILLDSFQNFFGGYLAYRKSQDTYYYQSTSFNDFWKVLKYFDSFSLQSSRRYLIYRLMRKAYLIVQNNAHFTPEGFEKLKGLYSRIHKQSEENRKENEMI